MPYILFYFFEFGYTILPQRHLFRSMVLHIGRQNVPTFFPAY
jgi:hypothetical protein